MTFFEPIAQGGSQTLLCLKGNKSPVSQVHYLYRGRACERGQNEIDWDCGPAFGH
jgi:hypothetical protein